MNKNATTLDNSFKSIKMKSLLFVMFLLSTFSLSAQKVKNYNLSVEINIEKKILHVTGNISVDFQNSDSIVFIFSKRAEISKLEGCNYSFNNKEDVKSPIPLILDGRKLIVRNKNKQKVQLYIDYKFNADSLGTWWYTSFSSDLIELGLYSGWFPLELDISNASFTCNVKINIDKDYIVTGSGKVIQKTDYWEMQQPWTSKDIVLIASKSLKSKKNNAIQLDYFSFPETKADSLIMECGNVFSFFNKEYGLTKNTYLKCVVMNDEQGGYSRTNFIRSKYPSSFLKFRYSLSHEIAHFWWHYAPSSSWEDWLNEAFAEYSALYYLRKIDKTLFDQSVEEYKSTIYGTPPIRNLDRSDKEAHTVLYYKGALILLDFEKRVGEKYFINFLLNK